MNMTNTEYLALYTLLNTVYSSKERHYHDINHIKYLQRKIREWTSYQYDTLDTESDTFQDETQRLGKILSAVDIAIWWHDFEYNIWNPPGINEGQSASAYKCFVEDYDETVVEAIKATAHHLEDQIIATDDNGLIIALMLDIDLAGFGESFTVVSNNSKNVLREYEPLGLEPRVLLENRVKFLDKLLKRNRIFYTDYFFEKYEQRARANIKLSIEQTELELLNV